MSENPYATPTNLDIPVHPESEAEAVRKEHIGTEASIKSIGILYWLAAIGMGLVSVLMLSTGEGQERALGALFLVIAIVYLMTGSAIRRFKPWSRVVTGILSGIGLIGFPVGTLINGYILYLIFGKKGKVVFTESYQEVIAATPHIKYQTSKWVWIVLGVIVLVIALAMIGLVVGNR